MEQVIIDNVLKKEKKHIRAEQFITITPLALEYMHYNLHKILMIEGQFSRSSSAISSKTNNND